MSVEVCKLPCPPSAIFLRSLEVVCLRACVSVSVPVCLCVYVGFLECLGILTIRIGFDGAPVDRSALRRRCGGIMGCVLAVSCLVSCRRSGGVALCRVSCDVDCAPLWSRERLDVIL